MVRRIVRGILKVIDQVYGFFLLLVRMPLEPRRPNPSKAAARHVREASHVARSGTAFTGTSATDSVFGKELAAGHKQHVYGDPMSERPVVGYGGRAPKHRRKPSGLVTLLLVLALVIVVVGLLQAIGRPSGWWFL